MKCEITRRLNRWKSFKSIFPANSFMTEPRLIDWACYLNCKDRLSSRKWSRSWPDNLKNSSIGSCSSVENILEKHANYYRNSLTTSVLIELKLSWSNGRIHRSYTVQFIFFDYFFSTNPHIILWHAKYAHWNEGECFLCLGEFILLQITYIRLHNTNYDYYYHQLRFISTVHKQWVKIT